MPIPKILILIDTRIIGGPGRGLFHFLESADHSKFDYVLCAFKYKKPGSQEFLEEALRRGFNVAVVEQKGMFDVSMLQHLSGMIRRGGFTIVQSHGYKSHLLALFLKIVHKIPWLAFSHGWTAENWKVKTYNKLDFVTLRFADRNVAVSDKIRDLIAKKISAKSQPITIENAINLKSLKIHDASAVGALRQKLSIPENAYVLGCFGRLSREKGQSLLLEACAALNRKDVHVIFLGDGIDRTILKEQSESLGLGQAVTFVGYQTDTSLYYHLINALVIPSLSEGLPNVLLEAMAYRKPVIATPVGAIPMVIEHLKTGIIADSITTAGLTQALSLYFDNQNQVPQITEKACTRVSSVFSAEARAKKIVALYISLAKKSGTFPD